MKANTNGLLTNGKHGAKRAERLGQEKVSGTFSDRKRFLTPFMIICLATEDFLSRFLAIAPIPPSPLLSRLARLLLSRGIPRF